MKPNTKPVHTWDGVQGNELEVGIMPARRKGLVCCCWNDFTEKYEYGECDGYRWNTIWNLDAVPGEFRVYLLLMGIA